jgi:aminoglycoside phosphotransferase (APT) family kinase protein
VTLRLGEDLAVRLPRRAEAAVLGRFLAGLHRPAPDDAPRNPFRGVPLTTRAEGFALGLDELARAADGGAPDAEIDAERLREVLARALTAPPRTAPPRWLHGDLHPRNVLTLDGRLSAIIDWGDLTAGDPATDLAGLWMLFDPAAHEGFWDAYGAGEPGLASRGRGWAAVLGLILLRVGLGDGDPRFTRVGRTTLARLTST